MMARGKLVGVHRRAVHAAERASTSSDRALLQLIAGRVAVVHRQCPALSPRRAAEPHAAHAGPALAGIQLDSRAATNCSARSPRPCTTLINYDAFSILLVDAEQSVSAAPLQPALRPARESRQHSAGQGHHRRRRRVARAGARRATRSSDPRYIASHPDIRSEIAVPLIVQDRVIGVMDLESERIGFFTEDHVRTADAARSADRQLRRKRAPVRGTWRSARSAWSRISRPPASCRTCCCPQRRRISAAWKSARLCARRARSAATSTISSNTATSRGDRFRRRQRQGRRGGALRRAGQRAAAHARPAPARVRPLLLRALNESLMERQVEARYVTLLVLLWQARHRRFTMANAGALPPMICRGGEILKLRVEGVPLGLLDDARVRRSRLPGGARRRRSCCIPTASRTSSNPDDEEYGRRRLVAGPEQPAQARRESVVPGDFRPTCDRFRGKPPAFDDQTYRDEGQVMLRSFPLHAFERSLLRRRRRCGDRRPRPARPATSIPRAAILEQLRAYDGPSRHAAPVCYAVKANSQSRRSARCWPAGAGFDIVSGGELFRVLQGRRRPASVVFSGVGKTADEIEYALESRHPQLQLRVGGRAGADRRAGRRPA